MTDFGGRAMCPVDEYDDLDLREEMVWHALEEALADAEILDDLRWLDSHQLADHLRPLITRLRVGDERGGITLVGYQLTLRAATDDYLGDDASGLVDLTATLIPVGPGA